MLKILENGLPFKKKILVLNDICLAFIKIVYQIVRPMIHEHVHWNSSMQLICVGDRQAELTWRVWNILKVIYNIKKNINYKCNWLFIKVSKYTSS